MLWRSIDRMVITQPCHAWLAGQLVRAWGNGDFTAPAPFEPVCLAAEQHDLGWLEWEREPTLNRGTGHPHMFREVPVATHTELWRRGVLTALAYGRFQALLVSLHGSGLYAGFGPERGGPAEQALVCEFIAEQAEVQQQLIGELTEDPYYRNAVAPAHLAQSRALIALTDRLSIAICTGVTTPLTVSAPALPDIALRPIADDPRRLAVTPWPFRATSLRVICEGRALPGRFDDESRMCAALSAAPRVTIVTELCSA